MCMQGLFFNEIGCWARHTRSAEMQEGIASAFHSAKDLKCDNKGFCCMFPSFMPRLLDALNLLLKRRGPSRNVKLSEGRAVNFNVTLESHCTRPGIACVCFSLTHHSQKVKSLGSGAPAMAHQIWHFALRSQIHLLASVFESQQGWPGETWCGHCRALAASASMTYWHPEETSDSWFLAARVFACNLVSSSKLALAAVVPESSQLPDEDVFTRCPGERQTEHKCVCLPCVNLLSHHSSHGQHSNMVTHRCSVHSE